MNNPSHRNNPDKAESGCREVFSQYQITPDHPGPRDEKEHTAISEWRVPATQLPHPRKP